MSKKVGKQWLKWHWDPALTRLCQWKSELVLWKNLISMEKSYRRQEKRSTLPSMGGGDPRNVGPSLLRYAPRSRVGNRGGWPLKTLGSGEWYGERPLRTWISGRQAGGRTFTGRRSVGCGSLGLSECWHLINTWGSPCQYVSVPWGQGW